jgi:hypothetical protein
LSSERIKNKNAMIPNIPPASAFLIAEAESLLTRLDQVRPFSLTMPMVPAAAVDDDALKGITDRIVSGQRELRQRVRQFIQNVVQNTEGGQNSTPETIQLRFSLLKLRFNALLDQLDIFADVLAQRAEHPTGIWVAGLDVLATDALVVARPYAPNQFLPPLMCFLERGHGAAIRRARTRLPGGDDNPVAVIQVPRERMVGSGIASSLVHEVGHQGAALLDLVMTLRAALQQQQARDPTRHKAWRLYDLWISEIIADFWSMAHLGISATMGLINVVSLPKYFVFRVQLDDPHPFPWIRVRLSLEMGKQLFPDQQWATLERLWHELYPLAGLPADIRQVIDVLIAAMPDFVRLMATHRSKALQDKQLVDIFPIATRQPIALRHQFNTFQQSPAAVAKASPSLVFAVIGQARFDRRVTPHDESKWLSQWLTRWAQARAENRVSPRQMLGIGTVMPLRQAA